MLKGVSSQLFLRKLKVSCTFIGVGRILKETCVNCVDHKSASSTARLRFLHVVNDLFIETLLTVVAGLFWLFFLIEFSLF